MSMYPDLGPVEVGEVVRFDSSGDCKHYFGTVSRLTTKLVYVDGIYLDGPGKFSRKHGAEFVDFCYDAYTGRIRKLSEEDRQELKAMERVSNG